jgi:hypothetical protein
MLSHILTRDAAGTFPSGGIDAWQHRHPYHLLAERLASAPPAFHDGKDGGGQTLDWSSWRHAHHRRDAALRVRFHLVAGRWVVLALFPWHSRVERRIRATLAYFKVGKEWRGAIAPSVAMPSRSARHNANSATALRAALTPQNGSRLQAAISGFPTRLAAYIRARCLFTASVHSYCEYKMK